MIHYHSLLGTWDLLIYWLQTNQYGRYGDGSIVTVPNLGTYTYIYIWASYRGLMDWWARISWQFHEYPYWLVVWNMFYFSIYWECHHPNWLFFFRGVGIPPTSLCCWWNSLWSTIKFPWIPMKLPDFHGGTIARRCCWNWNPNWLPKRRPSTKKPREILGMPNSKIKSSDFLCCPRFI